MVAAAKASVPAVGDQAAALQLENFAKATALALAQLRVALAWVDIDSAVATMKDLSKELLRCKQDASKGNGRE